jgi:hypothetical protein
MGDAAPDWVVAAALDKFGTAATRVRSQAGKAKLVWALAEIIRSSGAADHFAAVFADAYSSAVSPVPEQQRAAMMALCALIEAAPGRIDAVHYGGCVVAARAVLSGDCHPDLSDAAVALWCTAVRAADLEVEPGELAAVLALVPTPRGGAALVYELRFVAHAAARWPDAAADLREHGWALFRSLELLYRAMTGEELLFFAQWAAAPREGAVTEQARILVAERLAELAL